MRHRHSVTALIAASLIGAAIIPASAQDQRVLMAMGNAPGGHIRIAAPQNAATAGIRLAPGGSSTTTTGMGTGAMSRPNPNLDQPGVPGTAADDAAHPGLPARPGQ